MNTERRDARPAKKRGRFVAPAAGAAFVLAAWCLLPFAFGESIVPFPWIVAARLGALLAGPELWLQTALTLARTLGGFLLALVLGTAAGIASGRVLALSRSLFVPVAALQGTPPLLWIVPLVLILGSGGLAPVGVVFFVVLPIVVISVQEGMKTLDPAALEMMKVYSPSRLQTVREVYLPGLAGHFKSLILTGLLVGLKSSIIGEWFGAREGVGRMINGYFYTFDMPSFYAVAAFYVAVAAAAAGLAGRIGRRAFARRPSAIDPAAAPATELVGRRARSARLELADVTFAFGKKTICDRVSFSLGSGKTAVLTGESGAGKTTLARLALGLLKPKAGRVSVPANARLIFQEDAFLNHRDCFRNVALAVRTGDRAQRAGRALAALAAVGLGEQARQFPDELSGGMKKRLAFARALAADPGFLILDEPFNKLHKKARRELWDLSFKLFAGKGIPMLVITHFPEELRRRKGIDHFEMKDGKVTASQKS